LNPEPGVAFNATPGFFLEDQNETERKMGNGTSGAKVQPIERAFAGHNLQSLRHEKTGDAKRQLLILFGTVTGNAESVAGQAALAAAGAGFDVQVQDMARCEADILTRQRYLLVITSTYGNGEPPESTVPFWQAVVHGHPLNLRGVRFSVLALGNSTYDHFCQCGRDFDAALERHGATRFYPRVDCDADYQELARCWIDGTTEALKRHEFVPARPDIESGFPELGTFS
jgi:sulfite reductase alpha subunit-like flavoprotein